MEIALGELATLARNAAQEPKSAELKRDIMKTKGLGFMQLTIVVGFCLYYGYYLIAFFGALQSSRLA